MKNSLFKRANRRRMEMVRLTFWRDLTPRESKTLMICQRVVLRGVRKHDRRSLDAARRMNASLASLEAHMDRRIIKRRDREIEDVKIAEVTGSAEHGWYIKRSDGWSFGVDGKHGIVPAVGDTARFYGRGIGYTVRGLDINGREVYYKTPDEQEAEDQQKHDQFEQEQIKAEEKSRREFAAKLAADPLAFDWDRSGPSPEAAEALDRLTTTYFLYPDAEVEDDFPMSYSGQAWRYAFRLWVATARDPNVLDGVGPYDSVPGVEEDNLDLTGFMVGWARNSVRQMRGKQPGPNGAILTIGGGKEEPVPSGASAAEDMKRVIG